MTLFNLCQFTTRYQEELIDVARSYDRLYDIGDFPWRVARTIAEELGEYLL